MLIYFDDDIDGWGMLGCPISRHTHIDDKSCHAAAWVSAQQPSGVERAPLQSVQGNQVEQPTSNRGYDVGFVFPPEGRCLVCPLQQ